MCEKLTGLKFVEAKVTSAETVGAGQFSVTAMLPLYEKLPAFCRVQLTLTPSTDSDIKVEVWLPLAGWNGKYQAVGNGGWAGSISYSALATALLRGYAASATDTGHAGGGGAFALGHPEKLVDYAWRSEHAMVLRAKLLMVEFYGKGPQYSYWNGCSAGGKQGLKEAQRFPDDFDGIVAGAPAANWTGRATQSMWIAQAVRAPGAALSAADFALVHRAVLDACDAQDGVKDGVLENPRACKFDPAVLACDGDRKEACLSAAQVEAVRKIYAAVVDGAGKVVFPGHERGSELGWNTMAGARPFAIGLDHFRYAVFGDASWEYSALSFPKDADLAARTDKGLIDALNPNFERFANHGGKLIQYHGWNDPQISPGSSVDYFESARTATAGAQRSYRLFMVPGMAHCGGGEGPNQFDMLGALEQWVEQKKAPERVIVSRVQNGTVVRTRPLCPYPQVASYKGSGSTDEAANFVCKAQ